MLEPLDAVLFTAKKYYVAWNPGMARKDGAEDGNSGVKSSFY